MNNLIGDPMTYTEALDYLIATKQPVHAPIGEEREINLEIDETGNTTGTYIASICFDISETWHNYELNALLQRLPEMTKAPYSPGYGALYRINAPNPKPIKRYTEEQVKLLALFAFDIINFKGISIDGGEIQEIAVKHQILETREIRAPCGDDCECAEFYSQDDFKNGITCYFLAPWVLDTFKD